jgi:hypothetical protein
VILKFERLNSTCHPSDDWMTQLADLFVRRSNDNATTPLQTAKQRLAQSKDAI